MPTNFKIGPIIKKLNPNNIQYYAIQSRLHTTCSKKLFTLIRHQAARGAIRLIVGAVGQLAKKKIRGAIGSVCWWKKQRYLRRMFIFLTLP